MQQFDYKSVVSKKVFFVTFFEGIRQRSILVMTNVLEYFVNSIHENMCSQYTFFSPIT